MTNFKGHLQDRIVKTIIVLVPLLIITCASNKVKQKSTLEANIQNALNFISNDYEFQNRIINYYPDFNKCLKLNFTKHSYIIPVSYNEFTLGTLQSVGLIDSTMIYSPNTYERNKRIFDSIYFFSEFEMAKYQVNVVSNDCELKLIFSKKINGLLPIKFQLVDKSVDTRIEYTPRKGLYVLEFNNDNKIVHRKFITTSN